MENHYDFDHCLVGETVKRLLVAVLVLALIAVPSLADPGDSDTAGSGVGAHMPAMSSQSVADGGAGVVDSPDGMLVGSLAAAGASGSSGVSVVSAGAAHSCAVHGDGSLLCWGANQFGQASAPGGSFSAVSVGGVHSCGVKTDGSMVCWGFNDDWRATAPRGSFSAVSAGVRHSCGLRTDGSLVCWGANHFGQASAPGGSFSAVSVGVEHSCGLRTDESVVCWGNDEDGRASPPGGSFSSVSAGGVHSCGLRTDGSVVCWRPVGLAPSGPFDAVSAGLAHSCGLRTDGSVECWGHNAYRQSIPPEGSFSAVSAGGAHSCGLRADGSVVCWGANHLGQSTAPQGRFSAVAAGGEHSCGLRTDGSVECWGYNSDGQSMPPGGSFTAISAGLRHSCGLGTDGSVQCWGDNAVFIPAAAPGTSGPVGVAGERFADIAGNPHRDDIDRMAVLGITLGCTAGAEPRYCPDGHVTRAQMAAFLLRAIGQPDPRPADGAPFSDVPGGAWYTEYVLALAEMGVDTGENGEWRPDDDLTRLEMARWLTRLFDHITPAASPQGLFRDVDRDDWPVVEGLYQLGVTEGCSTRPLRFCPDQPVTRAEMASFIIRSLAAHPQGGLFYRPLRGGS